LIVTHLTAAKRDVIANCLDQSQGPDGDNLGGILRNVEGDLDVALGTKVIDFVGVNSLEHPPQPGTVGQVAVVQNDIEAAEMGVVIEMVDAISVEKARTPYHPMDFVAFPKQELGKV